MTPGSTLKALRASGYILPFGAGVAGLVFAEALLVDALRSSLSDPHRFWWVAVLVVIVMLAFVAITLAQTIKSVRCLSGQGVSRNQMVRTSAIYCAVGIGQFLLALGIVIAVLFFVS